MADDQIVVKEPGNLNGENTCPAIEFPIKQQDKATQENTKNYLKKWKQ